MSTFATRISGIPCQIRIQHLTHPQPMRVYGLGVEDVDPPEPGEFEFEVLDRKGYKASWLADKLKEDDIDRLYEEASASMLADRYGYVF
jgi:hypothetical protein